MKPKNLQRWLFAVIVALATIGFIGRQHQRKQPSCRMCELIENRITRGDRDFLIEKTDVQFINVVCTESGMFTNTLPLHTAIALDDIVAVESLLRNGANANNLDERGQLPLEMVVRSWSDISGRNIANKLYQYGADLDVATTDGRRCLHVAVCGERVEAVEWLLSMGADVHASDRLGNTALHAAALLTINERVVKIVNLLCDSGSSLASLNHMGRSPIDDASSPAMRELISARCRSGGAPE